ncbi:MAG: response regulator [Calditrichaeota bacterium]|nr:MAG: response regulator [Calditrichota bacterium]
MQRIMIIDDEADIRGMLKKMLEREEYEVIVSSNGKEGLELFSKEPTDLVITDIVMPEKEGIETITELKKHYRDVKIIAMSGGGNAGVENYLRMAKAFGANRTLAKPFQRIQLLTAVKDLLFEDVLR